MYVDGRVFFAPIFINVPFMYMLQYFGKDLWTFDKLRGDLPSQHYINHYKSCVYL